VPDGDYQLVLTTNDPNGIAGKTVAPIAIDTHGPSIHFKRLRIKPRAHLVISVTDAVSGVSTATLVVDGRVIARSRKLITSFTYAPPGGWARGRHTVTVLSRDRTYNFSAMTRTVVVR